MRPFHYTRASDAPGAIRLAAQSATGPGVVAANAAPVQFMAGGTTMLDLMKLGAMTPASLIDINALDTAHGLIQADAQGLRLGALVRMAQGAGDPHILRDYPVIAQSLDLAASQQLRNMASLGGNVLQRTRCSYFRDPDRNACNKRIPGSGCAALEGINRKHAVLGVTDRCIASYPGDFAQALVALDATVEILGPQGPRAMPVEKLHLPDRPEQETVLAPGELITGFTVPAGAWTRRSLYLKIRDRQSYAFALASAAVALDMDGDHIRSARIALGGVAYRPWRAREAEALLAGKPLTQENAATAARAAFLQAQPRKDNAYKIALGQRVMVRALMQAGRLT